MNRFLFSAPLLLLHETPGGASGAPAPDATPNATPSAPAAATPATPQVAPAAPPTAGAPEAMVPSYRLRETREAALREAQTRFEAQAAEIRAEAERYKAQIQALVGVTPPANPEVEAVRSQFSKLYPGLAKMEERAADLERLIERGGDLEAQTQHYWQSYGRQTMDRLFTHASEALGGPLTEEGKRQLHASFTGFVSSSPELTARYASDPSIVEDFWQQFTSSFIDPVRRAASANVAGRVPGALPQDSPSGAPQRSATPRFASLDERVAAGWEQLNHKT